MTRSSGTIFIKDLPVTVPHSPAPAETPRVILPPAENMPAGFSYEVNESWVGLYPFIGAMSVVGGMIVILWIVSIGMLPGIVGFERAVFELVTGVPVAIDLVQKINGVFAVILLIVLVCSGIWVFNFWRYQILGEWRFTEKGMEVIGHYPTLGSELIEYEYLKTIVTYRRQQYRMIIPGVGELVSLYMFWKYGLSEIEIRTELSYLNAKGEHQPTFTIDYVENGREVAMHIRDILNASKDKSQGFRGLPPGLFRRMR